MLGAFISITIIQALTGILLIAIPSNTSECAAFDWSRLSWLMGRHALLSFDPSADPVGRFSCLCFRCEDKPRDGLCVDIPTIWYFFLILSESIRLHVDTSHRCCSVRFDYLPIAPRGRQNFDTTQDNR